MTRVAKYRMIMVGETGTPGCQGMILSPVEKADERMPTDENIYVPLSVENTAQLSKFLYCVFTVTIELDATQTNAI
jgi:hypothetical protein